MNIDLTKSLGYNLGTTFFALGSLLSRNLSDHNINLTQHQAKMLMFLGKYEGIKQQELAGILQKDKPTITKMIDALENYGMVERKMDANDRRNRLLYLTAEGKDLRKKIIPVVQQTIKEATRDINKKEFDQLIQILSKIRSTIHTKLEKKA